MVGTFRLTVAQVASIALLSFAVLLSGCGSASNNDQGVSFTMLGYSIANTAAPTTGTNVVACSTSPNLSGGVFALGSSLETAGATNQVVAGVVVQNNLTTQFVRTINLDLDFIIPGADITPPSTTIPYGGVVAKAGGLRCGVVPVVPPQIISWMNLNRNSLPQLPFSLIVRGQVKGATTSGDIITSNPVDIGFTVVEDNIIPPAQGDTTTGNGGAIVGESFDSTGFVEPGSVPTEDIVDGDISDGDFQI